MALSTINPGDRIRMVTFLVGSAAPDGSFAKPRRINLRYSWVSVDPEHMCTVANDSCHYCESQVLRIARRHLPTGHVVTGITAIRDGQTTMLDRNANTKALDRTEGAKVKVAA